MTHPKRKAGAVHRHHVQRSLPRRLAGWALIGLAFLGMALPVMPGLIFLALGILVLGPHDPVLRRAGVAIRLLLRRLSRVRHRWLRMIFRTARWHYADARRQVHEAMHRHRRGELGWRAHLPMLAMMLATLTASAAIGLAIVRTIP